MDRAVYSEWAILRYPVVSLGAKVRYLMMRGIETVQAEKASRTVGK